MGRARRSCRRDEDSQASSSAQTRKALLLLSPDSFLALALRLGRHISRRPCPISGELLCASVEREDQTRRRNEQERAIPPTFAHPAIGIPLRRLTGQLRCRGTRVARLIDTDLAASR